MSIKMTCDGNTAVSHVAYAFSDVAAIYPITLSIHRRMMERINRTINLHGASPHIFRHSYATLLNDAGASVKTIQAIIGHSDVQTTINRYVHSREDKKQEAVRSVNEMLAVQRVKQC